MATKLSADFAALKNPVFRRYWSGQAASSFGDGMVTVATAFAVIGTGAGAGGLGLVLAAGSVARVLSAVAGGVVADRTRRRRVMAIADSARFAIQAVLGAVLLAGHGSIWLIMLMNMLYGIAAGFYGPAAGGFLPSIVRADLLQQANALQALTRSTAMILGPALSGLIIAATDPGSVFLIDAATFAVNVAALLTLAVTDIRRNHSRTWWADLVHGGREVIKRPWYALNLLAHAAWNLGIAAFFVLGPIVAQQRLGGAAAWGIVSAGLSVGALIGSAIALRWRPGRPLVVGNLALTLAALPLLALAVPLNAPVIAVAAAACNGGVILLNELWTATLQRIIPEELLSRVLSYDWLVSLVTLPMGYALVGPTESLIGERPTLAVAVVLTVVPASLVCLIPTIRTLRGPTRPTEPLAEASGGPTPPLVQAAAGEHEDATVSTS